MTAINSSSQSITTDKLKPGIFVTGLKAEILQKTYLWARLTYYLFNQKRTRVLH